jgi:hypothetical protein
MEVSITIENTAERSDATDVILEVTIEIGGMYVDAIDPAGDLQYGNIAPHESRTQFVTLTLNDAWRAASAGERIRVYARVIQETSRPEHTVGKMDSATIAHTGSCPP